MSCQNADPIFMTWIGTTPWGLRHRTGYYLGVGVHGSEPHSEEFNETFWWRTTEWAQNTATYVEDYWGKVFNWFGDIGITACNPGAAHQQGRAFDGSSRFSGV